MKNWIAAVGLLLVASASTAAQEPPPDPKLGKAVKAAAEAKARNTRKKPASRVITNDDVKRSKGTLIELAPTAEPAGETKPAGPPTQAQQDERYHQRLKAEEQVKAAQAAVETANLALAAIEQQYYEEDDPNIRDLEIRKRFAEAKGKAADAKRDLDASQELLKSFEAPTQ